MEWKTFTINECCEILDSQRVPLNSEERAKIQGSIPYYGANGIQGYINKFLFDEDLILVAEDGGNFEQFATRPIAYKIFGKSWVNNHAHILKAKRAFSQDFIFYSIVHKNILYHIQGGTRSKLNQSDLKSIALKIPELKKEQATIATILTTIDQAIEKTEQLIAKYERTKTGLMQDLLTRGIDEHRNIRTEETHEFKDSGLGRIPREWQIGTIGDFCFVTKLAGFEFTNYIRYIEDGEIIALRALNIKNEKVVLDDIQRISKKVSDLLTRSKLYAGDILITYIGAYIGDVLQIRENDKYHLAPNIAKIVPPKYIVNDFFEMYLRSYPIQIQMKNVTVTTATPSLTMKQIRNLTVAFPNDEYEQNRIVDAINTVNHTLRSNEENYRNLKMLKTGLMQDLLTGKVRVDSLI